MLVRVEHPLVPFFVDDGNRLDLPLEAALIDRADRLHVGVVGELVHLFPGHPVLVRDEVRGDPLGHDLVPLEKLR